MLIKPSSGLKYSDVTPRDIYLNRRKFLYGLGLAGGLAMAGGALTDLLTQSVRADRPDQAPRNVGKPVQHHREDHSREDRNYLQQLLRIWHGKGSTGQERAKVCDLSLDGFGRRRMRQAAKVFHGRNPETGAAGGTHLPASLVEAWSIVVPWTGYSFSTLAKLAEPNSNAKYVAFESYFDKNKCRCGASPESIFPMSRA